MAGRVFLVVDDFFLADQPPPESDVPVVDAPPDADGSWTAAVPLPKAQRVLAKTQALGHCRPRDEQGRW